MADAKKPRILVLGGGFAGLESAFLLRKLLAEAAEITLISDNRDFFYRPNSIYIPFGLDPNSLMIAIPPACAKKDIRFINSKIKGIDIDKKTVDIGEQVLPYDYAIICTGAAMRPTEITGLREHANSIWTVEDMLELRRRLEEIVLKAGAERDSKVLFLIPQGNKCSGPLYEMVLMLDSWLRTKGARNRIDISYSTFEKGYIQVFGPRLNGVITEEFEHRGINGYKEHAVSRIEAGKIFYANGAEHTFDLLITFPPYIAAETYKGLPADDRGFITTDLATRKVSGMDDLYAAGDAGNFPVKQAFLAFLQADTAASQVAALVQNKAPSLEFDPVSMCVMEQFDKATFAQVPLRLTGDASLPVEVRPEDVRLYKVGSSSAWRLGKKLLSLYLPWRFKAGEPFHAGLPWEAMEIGLKVMSATLAK